MRPCCIGYQRCPLLRATARVSGLPAAAFKSFKAARITPAPTRQRPLYNQAPAAAVVVAAGGATASSSRGDGAMAARVLCSKFLSGESLGPDQHLAVVLLNWTLPELTPRLWHKASLRVCADGGANRLYHELPRLLAAQQRQQAQQGRGHWDHQQQQLGQQSGGHKQQGQPPADGADAEAGLHAGSEAGLRAEAEAAADGKEGAEVEAEVEAEAVRAAYLPTVIVGDLDSICPDVLHFYRQRGVEVMDLSEDQDSTDLQKCIKLVQQRTEAQHAALQGLTVVALGALGGRLDHTLSSLSTLYSYRHLDLVLLGDGNLARLAPAGRCVIRPDHQLEGPSCGLVPLAGPAVASSSGLRWNLERTGMAVGGLISTSNLIEGEEVGVESDADLVWTTQLRRQSGGAP